ncbi:hypothetical protein P9112_012764 [Eukaryota sp. TZLM1-RC]
MDSSDCEEVPEQLIEELLSSSNTIELDTNDTKEEPSGWRDVAHSIVRNSTIFSTTDFSRTAERCFDKLKEVAISGDLNQLCEMLQLPQFWSCSMEEQDIIESIIPTLPKSEFVIKYYFLIQLNQFAVEQERIVIITDKALYRVKFNWSEKRPTKTSRIALDDITFVQYGKIHNQSSRKAVRIFTTDPSIENRISFKDLFTKNFSHYSTFTSPPFPEGFSYVANNIIMEIVWILTCILNNLHTNSLGLVVESEIYAPKRAKLAMSILKMFKKKSDRRDVNCSV